MVLTWLAAIKNKNYILPTNNNLNNSNNLNSQNDNDNGASNIVIDNENIELIVPKTQTQIVDATQYGTESTDDED